MIKTNYIIELNKFPKIEYVPVSMAEPTQQEIDGSNSAIAYLEKAHEQLRNKGFHDYKIEKIFVQIY